MQTLAVWILTALGLRESLLLRLSISSLFPPLHLFDSVSRILFETPVVMLSALSALFADPRGGKARVKEAGGRGVKWRNCMQTGLFPSGWRGSFHKASLLAAAATTGAAELCPTPATPGLQPAGLLCAWDSPGKNPGVGCHFLLQAIFPTQGSNPSLLH